MPSLMAAFTEPVKKNSRPDEEKLGTAPGEYLAVLNEIFMLVDKDLMDTRTKKPLVKAVIFKFLILTAAANSKKEPHQVGMLVGKYIDANPTPAHLQSSKKALVNIVGTLMYVGDNEFEFPDLNNEAVRSEMIGTVIKISVPAEETKNAKGETTGWHFVNFKELAVKFNIRIDPQPFIQYLTDANRPAMVDSVNKVLATKPFEKKADEVETPEENTSTKTTTSVSDNDSL